MNTDFPVIDPIATGKNIQRLRLARGLTVRDLQMFFGFEEPQAIYKWQKGKSLPSVDNLYALSTLLRVPMEDILVPQPKLVLTERQTSVCRSAFSILYTALIHLSFNCQLHGVRVSQGVFIRIMP